MKTSSLRSAALEYAARGWFVFPMTPGKRPLSQHGLKDATTDKHQIETWCHKWPDAVFAVRTGRVSGLVVADIDFRDEGNGRDSLEAFISCGHPIAPTAHSPSGGFHLFYLAPTDIEVRNSVSSVGPFLDVRGENGSVMLPPAPGRYWDPLLNLQTIPLSCMPAWLGTSEQPRAVPSRLKPRASARYRRSGELALDDAVKRILTAPAGQQEITLNREVYRLGRLVSGGAISASLALEGAQWAARSMHSFDWRRPWLTVEIERKVANAFAAGLRNPGMVFDGNRD